MFFEGKIDFNTRAFTALAVVLSVFWLYASIYICDFMQAQTLHKPLFAKPGGILYELLNLDCLFVFNVLV